LTAVCRCPTTSVVTAVCQSDYYQLRQLRPVARCSSEDAAKTMIQAFVISRLDYCNALCYGITDELTRCLQSVQNAAARLVTAGHQAMRSYLACAPPAALASCAAARRVQDSDSPSTSPCPATPRVTWPTTVSSSPTPMSDKCVLLTLESNTRF